MTLTLSPDTFPFPPDIERLSGTYERLGTGAGEHAIYGRIKTVPPPSPPPGDSPNVHDVWISYLWFASYSLNGDIVFNEGYCLQWTSAPIAAMDLRNCQYIAKNPGINSRMTDPATPATGPLGDTLVWTINTYPTSPDFPVATGMNFVCENCLSCPEGYKSSPGSIFCEECPIGYYAGDTNQAGCKSCPSGYFEIDTTSTRCDACPTGTFSDANSDSGGGGGGGGSGGGGGGGGGGIQACEDCRSGYYSDDYSGSGIISGGDSSELSKPRSKCMGCPSGYHQRQSGQSFCEQCPRGWGTEQSNSGNSGNNHGQITCHKCLGGTFSSSLGSITCSSCPIGYYQPRLGALACLKCSEGSISDKGATRCTSCPPFSFVHRIGTAKEDGTAKEECVTCPKCVNNFRAQCGTCDLNVGFIQNEGFWNPNRTDSSSTLSSISTTPLVSVNEVFLKCDVIGFKRRERVHDGGGSDDDVRNSSSKAVLMLGTLEEETACHINENKSQTCKQGYRGFLCGACALNFGHGSRKSTCQKCDSSNAGPFIRMGIVIIVGMSIVAYIVKRKTRKQSASLERVGLLYFQFTGYAMALAVNWPSYVHVFLQLESNVGNANSFSYSDVECSFKKHLVFGSWFYTYCLTLLIVPML